jgi:hypothetical protein
MKRSTARDFRVNAEDVEDAVLTEAPKEQQQPPTEE